MFDEHMLPLLRRLEEDAERAGVSEPRTSLARSCILAVVDITPSVLGSAFCSTGRFCPALSFASAGASQQCAVTDDVLSSVASSAVHVWLVRADGVDGFRKRLAAARLKYCVCS
jgi:hypothetical protein